MCQQVQVPVGARPASWEAPREEKNFSSSSCSRREGVQAADRLSWASVGRGRGGLLLPHLFSDLQVPATHVCMPARVLECCPL